MNDIDIQTGWSAAWQSTLAFAPKLVMFLLILVAGYYASRLLAKGFDRVLERVGFDRLVERGGIKQALAKTPYDASDLLSKLLFYTVFLFVLQLAFGVFGPNPVSELLTRVIAFLPSIAVAALIIVVASAVAKGVKDILGSAMAAMPYGRFVANAASIGIITVGVFAALSELGIAPAIVNALFYALLVVVAGSAVVAIGGGGIAPMRAEWERGLQRLHGEAPRIRVEAERLHERAERTLQDWEQRQGTAPGGNGGQTPGGTPPARH